MKLNNISIAILLLFPFLVSSVWAQTPASGNQNAAPAPTAGTGEVPRLIKFSGTLVDAHERPVEGPVGVSFALYAQQTGGAALWMETQNVKPDANSNYTVLLGANSANGVPAELFASGEARWLGIQVGQQPEHERILLVSVPYALKARDAETLGGLPASAFVTTGTNSGGAAPASSSSPAVLPNTQTQSTPNKAQSTPQAVTPCSSVTSNGAATANSIALFTTACKVQSSLMTQALINGFPGVTLAGNNAGLLLGGAGTHQVTVTGATSGRLGQDANGFFFVSDTNGSNVRFLTNNGTLNEWMRITSAGNVGIGTATPAAKLDILGDGVSSPTISVSGSGNAGGSGESRLLLKTTNTGGPATWSIRAGSSNSILNLRFGLASAPDMMNLTPAGHLGIGTAVPSAVLHVVGKQPASLTSGASSAATALEIDGGKGGNATDGLSDGGVGGAVFINSGAGGDSIANGAGAGGNGGAGAGVVINSGAGGDSNLFAGTGGSITVNSGAGGNGNGSLSSGGDGGAGGSVTINAGGGGTSTVTGAAGGSIILNAGAGANAAGTAGQVGDGGNGGSMSLQPGAPGSGSAAGAPGIAGSVFLAPSGGTVSISTFATTSVLAIGQNKGHAIADGWDVYSSLRWKTNIHPIPGALAKLERLRGVAYDRKSDGKHEIGVVAEEVGRVVPEVVSYEDNGVDARGVDYARLTALLIQAVKEQQAQIKHQKAQIKALQVRLRRIETRSN